MPRVKTEGSVARRRKWSVRSSLFQVWLHHSQLPPLPLSSSFLDSGCCALLEILRQLSEVLKHLQTLWGIRAVISREIKWKRKWYRKKRKEKRSFHSFPPSWPNKLAGTDPCTDHFIHPSLKWLIYFSCFNLKWELAMDQAKSLWNFLPHTSSNLFQTKTSRAMRRIWGFCLPFPSHRQSEQQTNQGCWVGSPLTQDETPACHKLTDSHLILTESEVSSAHILRGKKRKNEEKEESSQKGRLKHS